MRAMQDGLALLPGFSTAICDQKAGKELGNKAKTGNQNYLRACILIQIHCSCCLCECESCFGSLSEFTNIRG